jgi:hypothetical protein
MRASVRLELRNEDGSVAGVRQARNSVMRGGAELIASLFSGTANGGITHMGVGISAEPESDTFSRTALTTAGDAPDALTGDTEAPVTGADFVVRVDETRRLAIVEVHATVPKGAAVGTLREAGLIARGGAQPVLYNRVTFAPIAKKSEHELTMFWEVTFPYGDLNWM